MASRCAHGATAPEAPSEWVDPATGHVIVRLSKEAPTASMYFHQNGYTPDGKKLLIFTPEGMSTVDLQTHKIDLLVPGFRALSMSMSNGIEVSRKEPVVYYNQTINGKNAVIAMNMNTHEWKEVAELPTGATLGGLTPDDSMIIGIRNVGGGRGAAVGTPATETPTSPFPETPQGSGTPTNPTRGTPTNLGRGTPASPTAQTPTNPGPGTPTSPRPQTPTAIRPQTPATPNPQVAAASGRGARAGGGAGGQSKQIYTVNLKTGETKTFFPSEDNLSHDNLNHFETSPTDPNLILFAHEGNWATMERIWTMHTDGTGLKLMHVRTMPNEIAGHEFFSRDGEWVYYDLQTPESVQFWLAGANVKTGEHIRYPIERSEWSVHYYVSWNGKMFLGDGGGPNSVANRLPGQGKLNPPQNGQWMYLFTPTGEYTTMDVNGEKVKVGKLNVEKLADLRKHDYGNGEPTRVEPNGTFTPDDKWITFRSNMEGALHVYEVEVAKATPDEIKRIDAEWAEYKAATAK